MRIKQKIPGFTAEALFVSARYYTGKHSITNTYMNSVILEADCGASCTADCKDG